MTTLANIHPYFHDDHPVILDEMTYKDIFNEINPQNLPHRDYAPLIKFVKFQEMKNDTMKFFVPNKYNGWSTYAEWVEYRSVVTDQTLTATDGAKLLLWAGNIKVFCGCPAFLFWGSQYILTQLDASIVPENRPPVHRNPNLKGIVCKHLNRTIKVLPFHLGDLAAAINRDRENM